MFDGITDAFTRKPGSASTNESVVRLMQQQLQQTVMTHGWIYTDAQLLRDDIQTLFTAERY